MTISRCPGNGRHWYTVPGLVGLRRPDCTRCGAPNPRKLNKAQQAEFEYAVRQGWTKPPKQRCLHLENRLEPTMLNPEDPNLRYCRDCTCVVERVRDEWIAWSPIISSVKVTMR